LPLLSPFLQICMIVKLFNPDSFILIIFKHLLDQILCFWGNRYILWKLHYLSVKHNMLFVNPFLRHIMSKRLLSEQHFIKDHTNWEYINFRADLGLWRHQKALRGKIPISSNSLWCQLYFWGVIMLHNFAKTKIGYFYFTIVEQNILRLDIKMDNDFALKI